MIFIDVHCRHKILITIIILWFHHRPLLRVVLIDDHHELSEKLQCLTTAESIGRPVYEKNDELLNVIKEIAILGSGADDRRNTANHTLNSLS